MPNLTTIRAVQAYLGAPAPAANLIGPLVSSASAAVLRYLPRDLFVTNYNETYSGSGTYLLPLRQFPIVSVSSVMVDGANEPLSTGPFVSGYSIEQRGEPFALIRTGCYWPQWRWAQGNIQVSYSAGYAPLSVTDDPVAIPATPFILQSTNPYWQSDVGVSFFGGSALTKVSGTPTTGQYNVDSQGNYTFAAADTGRQIVLSYNAIGIPVDISDAVNQIVGMNVQRRSKINSRSSVIAQQTEVYITDEWPPSALAALSERRRFYQV